MLNRRSGLAMLTVLLAGLLGSTVHASHGGVQASLSASDAACQGKSTATSFVNSVDQSDGALDGAMGGSQVGVVAFATQARTVIGLSPNANSVRNAITSFSQLGGNTNLTDAIRDSQAMLAPAPHKHVLVLMTDGAANMELPGLNGQVADAKSAGTEIYTIGLGSSINVAQLQAIATSPAHYFQAPTAAQLQGIFNSIAQGVAGPAATGMQYTAQVSANFAVVPGTASASAGTISATASDVTWNLSELRTQTVTVSYQVQHAGGLGGLLPIHQSADLTWTGDDGAAAASSFASAQINVTGCNTPPVANAGPDQTVNATGPDGAPVTLDGTASTDDGAIAPLTYTWSESGAVLGTGSVLSHTFSLGTHTVTLQVSDGQLTADDTVVVTVQDLLPPVTNVSGAPGGWSGADVTLTLSAADSGSGVAQTYYQLDGGAVQAGTAVTVSTDGVHTIDYWSVDRAGNEETHRTVAVMVDKTPPTISGVADRAPNGGGWYNAPVTVSFTCADALSGVAACAGPQTLSGEGAGQSVTGDVADIAGNIASATVSGINIDMTAPVTSLTPSQAPNASGWYKAGVTAALSATDNLSGVAATEYNLDGAGWTEYTAPVAITQAGVHVMLYRSRDKADNLETAGTLTVRIDTTAPEAVLQVDPTGRDLQVFGKDDLSGVAPGAIAPTSVTLVRDGRHQGDWMDDDRDHHDGDHRQGDWKDRGPAELRTYVVTDVAGNTLQLQVMVARDRDEIHSRIVSLQYNGGTEVTAPRNAMDAEWDGRPGDALKRLEQQFKVGQGKGSQSVEADYNARKNETAIDEKSGKQKKVVLPGLVLLHMTTNQGSLAIEY